MLTLTSSHGPADDQTAHTQQQSAPPASACIPAPGQRICAIPAPANRHVYRNRSAGPLEIKADPYAMGDTPAITLVRRRPDFHGRAPGVGIFRSRHRQRVRRYHRARSPLMRSWTAAPVLSCSCYSRPDRGAKRAQEIHLRMTATVEARDGDGVRFEPHNGFKLTISGVSHSNIPSSTRSQSVSWTSTSHPT